MIYIFIYLCLSSLSSTVLFLYIYILFYFLTKQAMSNYIPDIDDCGGGCCCCGGGCHLEGCGASYSAFVRILLRKISVGHQVCSPLHNFLNYDKWIVVVYHFFSSKKTRDGQHVVYFLILKKNRVKHWDWHFDSFFLCLLFLLVFFDTLKNNYWIHLLFGFNIVLKCYYKILFDI